MLNDTDLVTVICDGCGMQAKQQVGRLKARLAQTDHVCGACGATIDDYAEQLERIIRSDAAYPFSKLRLRPTRI